jgi:hypothetical protein
LAKKFFGLGRRNPGPEILVDSCNREAERCVHEKPADGRTLHITKYIDNPIHPSPHYTSARDTQAAGVPRSTARAPTFWFGFRRKTVLAKADLKTALSSSATTTIFFATPLLQFYPLSRDFFLPLRSERSSERAERRVCIIASAAAALFLCAFRARQLNPEKSDFAAPASSALHDVVEEERKPFSLLYLRAALQQQFPPSVCSFPWVRPPLAPSTALF